MKLSRLQNYMTIVKILAKNSPDTKTQVGALLVSKETNIIVSTGYNGFVRGAMDRQLPNGDDDLKHDFMIHAEQNLICNAVRTGVHVVSCLVICTLSPCTRCLRLLWNAGIDTIYFPKNSRYKDLWKSQLMGDLKIKLVDISDDFNKLELSNKEY